ncbi:hypothetical protein PV350_33380 [Streptomyces sp. PA03-6a]|nr:hypothetical protein [Streptomyces sp. PA03-6a]
MKQQILAEIDGIAWDRFFHAYQVATDTPGHLKALLGDDEKAASTAADHLWSAILHQGTVWPATAPVARIAARMLAIPEMREGALTFLKDVAAAVDLADAVPELRARAYPAVPESASAIDTWLARYLAEDEDGQVDLWTEDGETGDLVLTRAALDCYDALPDLFDPVAELLDDPDADVRTAAWAAAAPLLRHPATAPRAAGLRGRLEAQAHATGSVEARASLLLDLGELGGEPRAWLADPDPAVRTAAALAPALADDPHALDVLVDATRSPRAFDRLSALPRFGGEPPRWTLVAVLCARVMDFAALYESAAAAVPLGFRLAPCPDLGPYLRVAFPEGLPEAPTAQQSAFARDVAARDDLWDAVNGNRKITFARLGLPDDREAWQRLGARGTVG